MLDRVWEIALLCGVSAANVTALPAQEAADHVAMGIAANEAHDLTMALRHFQVALEQDSSSYDANWRGALTLLDLAEQIPNSAKGKQRDSLYTLAERYATRAVTANPQGADGHFALAAAVGRKSLALGTKERIHRAGIIHKEALRAIELNPRHDGAYHILGRWNAEIMRISGISRFFARNFLGAGVFKEASWKKAVANMQKAVELDPGRIYHHLELARIYAERKRLPDAETQLHAVESLPAREVMDSMYKRQGAELRRRLSWLSRRVARHCRRSPPRAGSVRARGGEGGGVMGKDTVAARRQAMTSDVIALGVRGIVSWPRPKPVPSGGVPGPHRRGSADTLGGSVIVRAGP